MEKILVLLVMVLAFNTSNAQDRVNRQKLSFLDKSGQLTTAVGWSYNETLGEWVDYNNVIESDKLYKDKYKTLQGSYMMSRTEQNFISISTKTIIYKDIKYYILLVEKWAGYYKYPNIMEDWKIIKTKRGYIFSESEYNKLNNISGVVNMETQHIVVSTGEYDEIVFLDKIQTELSSEKSKYTPKYTFPFMKTENGNIRFYIPDFSRLIKVDFEKKYFETTLDDFNKIIIN